mgnify:CR=1 FL=1
MVRAFHYDALVLLAHLRRVCGRLGYRTRNHGKGGPSYGPSSATFSHRRTSASKLDLLELHAVYCGRPGVPLIDCG